MSFLLAVSLAFVNLAGTWQVQGTNFTAQATLPGTLASAHLGTRWCEHDFQTTMDLPQSEALVQEYQYVGKAVWTRTLTLAPEDCRHEQELFLERVMWRSEAFWDGLSLGACDSLASPHVYALPKLTPGRHTLKLVIDNACRYGFSRQSHAYGPNMQAVWNGVLGEIKLQRRHALRQVRVFATAPSGGMLRVEVPVNFIVSAQTLSIPGLEIKAIRPDAKALRPGFKTLVLTLGAEPRWWNEFHPQLYELILRDLETDFTHRTRFGFRSTGTQGLSLTLNGQRFFTRGNVDNANFARDGVPWMDKASWLKVFGMLKEEDGCNAVRFHTWCPPEAAFAAADELGIVLQPEAGIWTDGWMREGDPVGFGKPVDGFVRQELQAICDAYGNHPAFFSLAIGNELGNSNFPEMGKMIAAVRERDPRRLYYASSARDLSGADDFLLSHKVLAKGLAREKLFPHTDWDYEDIYAAAKIPVVAHEIGQWPVYPIWNDLLAPFTGTMRPWNLSRHRDLAVAKGTDRLQALYHTASARLNRLIYKEEVESFLRTPSCAGVQLLEAQDYTGQAEALVGWRDPFWNLKRAFTNAPSFAHVWGPIAYLARFARFTWQVDETFSVSLVVRNMRDVPLPAGLEIPWRFADQTGVVRLDRDIRPNEVRTVAALRFPLSARWANTRQTLHFGENEWSVWIYPREAKAPLATHIVATTNVVTMKRALASGKTVLYTGASVRSAKGTFKSVYWSARWFPVANTTAAALGTWFDVRHPALAGFVTEDFTDWQWYTLAEGATIHALKSPTASYRPIALSVNDFHFSDFTSPLFEVLVDSGRLLVCGYDLEADTPEARRLRASIFKYLEALASPATPHVSHAWLEELFKTSSVVPVTDKVWHQAFNWQGRDFTHEIRGVPPVTGTLVITFRQPVAGLTSGRGFVEGRVFEVPFTERVGALARVRVPVVRENFLDGALRMEVHLMTGKALGIAQMEIVK